jgi:hypothetical protein
LKLILHCVYHFVLQDLNPSIEAPASKIVDLLSEQFSGNHDCLDIKQSEARINIQLSTKLAGVPFHWEFRLTRQDDEVSLSCASTFSTHLCIILQQLANHVTLPLVAMTSELIRRQEKLFEILAKKDREIEERKCNGGNVSRSEANVDSVTFYSVFVWCTPQATILQEYLTKKLSQTPCVPHRFVL